MNIQISFVNHNPIYDLPFITFWISIIIGYVWIIISIINMFLCNTYFTSFFCIAGWILQWRRSSFDVGSRSFGRKKKTRRRIDQGRRNGKRGHPRRGKKKKARNSYCPINKIDNKLKCSNINTINPARFYFP